jgi:hypothetical protein
LCPSGSTIPFVRAGYFRRSDLGAETTYLCNPEIACLAAGYEDTACSKCSIGFFRLGNSCKKCIPAAAKWAVVVVSLIIVIIVIRRLWAYISRVPISVRVAMYWFQMFSLLPLLSDKWPAQLMTLFDIAKFGNLEFQYFGFDCDLKVTFWFTWCLKLMFPLGLLVFILSVWIVRKYGPLERYNIREIRKMLHIFVFFLSFFYTSVLGSVLEPFNCIQQTDGFFYLKASPSVKCFDDVWRNYLPLSIIFIVTYVLIFPLISLGSFFCYRKNLQDERFSGIYNSLINSYRPGFEYWEWNRLVSCFSETRS